MTQISTRLARKSDLPDVLDMVHTLAVHHNDAATLTLTTLERDALGDAPWITLIVAENATKLLGCFLVRSP